MATSSKKVLELFVGRIPWTIAQKELREYFTQFGVVQKCRIPFDQTSGFHKGFGWVLFSNAEAVNKALEKDTHILDDAKLEVVVNKRPFGVQKEVE